MVYATDPNFVTDSQSALRNAGTPAYLAVPVKAGSRTDIDTLQLSPAPPFSPIAMATGAEETEAAQAAAGDARLLLHYPSHTWFGWTATRVTAIRSSTYPHLKGQEFDTRQFKQWLTAP
ncbi:hypothetical protein [Nocardia sp. NPDC049149]|uniref:hypothetical protein n=1 Tax=Nocardia sp. NPDC049149 TaxID=3364315 RepID=UPI00372444D9